MLNVFQHFSKHYSCNLCSLQDECVWWVQQRVVCGMCEGVTGSVRKAECYAVGNSHVFKENR